GYTLRSQFSTLKLPALDVGYTYPDMNNVYLAHIGAQSQVAGDNNAVKVVIPSFHRPQYLRNSSSGAPIIDWQTNANTATRVLRPHPKHYIVGTTTPRF